MGNYARYKVLVVDDEASTRALLRAALEELGLEVTEAVDGADAMCQSIETQFDLTTMDIVMPNVDGLDAIRALRTVDPECRIIVVTSRRDAETVAAIRALNVPHLVFKPIALAALYAAVDGELAPLGEAASAPDATSLPNTPEEN